MNRIDFEKDIKDRIIIDLSIFILIKVIPISVMKDVNN